MNLVLYSTSGCHLCEEALALVHQLMHSGNTIEVTEVDIANDDALMDQYGVRIPVIKTPRGSEIGWPFTRQELEEFLATE